MGKRQASKSQRSLVSVANWRAKREGLPCLGALEYPLYSDSDVTGHVVKAEWPYAILNTIAHVSRPGDVQVTMVLRAELHLPPPTPQTTLGVNTSAFHGGQFADEIAALVSLCMGTRVWAGALSRRFEPSIADRYGAPIGWQFKPQLQFDVCAKRMVLPDVVTTGTLDDIDRLDTLLTMSDKESVALVRAARLYQDALWIAESEPHIAWLLLVAAVETAAQTASLNQDTPVNRMASAHPKLAKLLGETQIPNLKEDVAELLEPYLGATRKFTEFCMLHLPDPPPQRPVDFLQIDWSESSLRKILKTIYGHRSKALHGGTPFPAPMCEPPQRFAVSEHFSEIAVVGLSQSYAGGTWDKKSAPMNLHTFHYLVRQVLLKWWDTMNETNGRTA